MFASSNILEEYLKAKPRDMYDVVGALMGYINADPAFETNDFEDAISYVLGQGVSEVELYKDFNSDYDFEEDESKWNDKYYARARVYLKDNFCKERIEHVKKVARKLYPKPDGLSSIPKQKESNLVSKQVVQGNGGQQELGKKIKGQTRQSWIIKVLAIVKIMVCLMIIGVVLVLLIAFIIMLVEHVMGIKLVIALCRMLKI